MPMRAWILSSVLAVAASAAVAQTPSAALATATFAGGCFWCVEEALDKVPGVVSSTSGYMGGTIKSPTYQQVSAGGTGHTEVVQVTYDPTKVSYERLLEQFWVNHDPTVLDRQFCDKGSQYRPEIFYHSPEQKRIAEASKAGWQQKKPFKEPILTPVTAAGDFWPAEESHQNYHRKNPVRYKYYSTTCGRYSRLDQLWGKLRD